MISASKLVTCSGCQFTFYLFILLFNQRCLSESCRELLQNDLLDHSSTSWFRRLRYNFVFVIVKMLTQAILIYNL